VYGQLGSFTTAIQNKGGIGAHSLASPVAVTVDPAGNLYVTDRTNNRVLGFLAPLSDATADLVFGQLGNFTTTAYNIGNAVTADGLSVIHGIGTDAGGNLYIADQGNHRVLKYLTQGTSACSNTTTRRRLAPPPISCSGRELRAPTSGPSVPP
jgi:DNA-binding beta-propeller fold protein YncE